MREYVIAYCCSIVWTTCVEILIQRDCGKLGGHFQHVNKPFTCVYIDVRKFVFYILCTLIGILPFFLLLCESWHTLKC